VLPLPSPSTTSEPLPQFGASCLAYPNDEPAVGKVFIGELVLRYDRLRPYVSALELPAYDAALARVRDLPVDLAGRLDLPFTDDAADCSFPPLSTEFPRVLRVRAREYLRGAIDSSVLARCPRPRLWHKCFALLRADGVRLRLIADLRPSNERLPTPPPFTLDSHLSVADSKHLWAMKLDLSDAFWSIAVSPRMSARMAMSLDGVPLQWSVLPLGLSWAPYVFHTVLEPVLPLVRSVAPAEEPVDLLKYLDDFLVLSPTPGLCTSVMSFLIDVLRYLRFRVSATKTSTSPVQVIEFLGMEVNLAARVFRWPADKASKVETFAREALRVGWVRRGELAKFLGQLAFLCMCCPLLAVCRRALDALLHSEGTTQRVLLTPEATLDVQFWVREAAPLSQQCYAFRDNRVAARYVLATDASDSAGGVSVWNCEGRVDYCVRLPRALLGASSTARELFVTMCGLTFISSVATPGSVIDVYTDSQCSVAAMKGGARALDLRAFTLSLLHWQRASGLIVRPAWLPRELLDFQDSLSRSSPFAEASLACVLSQQIWDWAWDAPPTIDVFASPTNAVCARFVCAVPAPGCADVDGLRVLADECERVWCYPPFALAARAASHYSSQRASTVWVGPAHLGVHLGRRHAVVDGACLVVPPYDTARYSSVPLVVVILGL
jgi:hypothetical protein